MQEAQGPNTIIGYWLDEMGHRLEPIIGSEFDGVEEQEEMVAVILIRGPVTHTDEHPFCGDGDCPCHGGQTWEQIDYQAEYLEQPFNDGLLTVPEYHRLFWNQQL